jgi:DNA-binding transcriptional LysR family regulator
MHIEQLRHITEIAKTGSISQAAGRLFISQSTLSKSVKALETELGAELFRRHHSGVTPTDFGVLFLEKARVILQNVEAIAAVARSERIGMQDKLAVATSGIDFINAIYSRVLSLYNTPTTKAQYYRLSNSEVFNIVRNGTCELGVLVSLPQVMEQARRLLMANGMEYHLLARYPIGVTYPNAISYQMANTQGIRKRDLRHYAFITLWEELDLFRREYSVLSQRFGITNIVDLSGDDCIDVIGNKIRAFHTSSLNTHIYEDLGIPIRQMVFPVLDLNEDYEMGWIKRRDITLPELTAHFLRELCQAVGAEMP